MQFVHHTDSKSAATKKSAKGRRPSSTKETLRRKEDRLIVSAPTPDIADQIATAAYYLAEHRGFAPGRELEDWLEAERRVRGLNS